MLEEEVGHGEVRHPRERGNEGFGGVAAGRAVVQLPVGRIVGKALAGGGEIAARIRDEVATLIAVGDVGFSALSVLPRSNPPVEWMP
jgi:hypothetical protein